MCDGFLFLFKADLSVNNGASNLVLLPKTVPKVLTFWPHLHTNYDCDLVYCQKYPCFSSNGDKIATARKHASTTQDARELPAQRAFHL